MPEQDGAVTTLSGSTVLRHARPAQGVPASTAHDEAYLDFSCAHLAKHLGPVGSVYHEKESEFFHLDTLVIPPTLRHPFQTLVTCGMGQHKAQTPDGARGRRCELMLLLHPDWPLDQESLRDENNYWPLRLLRDLARFPARHDSWLAPGHTVSSPDHAPYAPDTKLCAALIAEPFFLPDEFTSTLLPDGETVHYQLVLPIYLEELRIKMHDSAEALLELLSAGKVSCAVGPDSDRPNVALP